MEMTPVTSSNVAAVGQDGEDLVVEFQNASKYRYRGAGHLHGELVEAESAGRYLNQNIKGQFESERIEDEPALPIG